MSDEDRVGVIGGLKKKWIEERGSQRCPLVWPLLGLIYYQAALMFLSLLNIHVCCSVHFAAFYCELRPREEGRSGQAVQ